MSTQLECGFGKYVHFMCPHMHIIRDDASRKGDAVNPIVNTVLPHDMFKDWVWQQLGMDGKRLFAQQHGHNRHE